MRAHVIENGMVVNTILVESLDFLPNLVDSSNGGKIGDLWDGENFTTPEPTTSAPESITPRQGMLILSRYNLLTPVQSALANMEGQEGVEARIDFERANEWKRDWPLLIGMATQFGLSSAQIDQMFVEASQL